MESLILIILVIFPGVQGGDWGVTSGDQCALRGSSVIIDCQYDYPSGRWVTSVGWSKLLPALGRPGHFILSQLPLNSAYFNYVGNYWSDCRLRINNVQHDDEGAYLFNFVTTINRWTSKRAARLSVRELTTVVEPSTVTEGGEVRLSCVSGCSTPVNILWFRDRQPVPQPGFQATREDAGRYYCAVQGQETVRSAPVALNVQYAPRKVTLSMTPSVIKGGAVTFSCSSDANPPVPQSGYSLHKDGHLISSGQNHTVSNIQPPHSGLYSCLAWNNISRSGISRINSTQLHLDVLYPPENISISMDPLDVVEGGSMNLSCSSAANPAAHSYTWFRQSAPSLSSMLRVGSGPLLTLPSVDASHTGLYLCTARNQLGENNSTEVMLTMRKEYQGEQTVPVLAGIGVCVFVALLLALLLFRLKQRTRAEKKPTVFDFRLSERGSSSSGPSDSVYANIQPNIRQALPSPPPAAQEITPLSQRSHHEQEAPMSYEDDVTYATVTIKPINSTHHMNSRSRAGDDDDSVIYASLA
ncbi:sialoadhesin-like [Gymnodraco acuticeps]|uniref:Sialoadhesin-like n=1 Tax=Gymnodraco acuticeps TaxID=8218 RepID=A0A6P8UA12_GYMAC|nr:sialoadhesin-like [Gymnodraco acuticeps]